MQSFSYWLSASILLTLLACGQKQNQSADQQTEVSPANSLFQKIDANASGISFQNEIQEDYQFNAITNPYLYNGGGVAVIDLTMTDSKICFLLQHGMTAGSIRTKET